MRIFLDECVDRRLASLLGSHQVTTAHSRRWLGLPDRALLDRCAGEIDVFVTADANLRHQQNLGARPFGFVIIRGAVRGFAALARTAPRIVTAAEAVNPGEVVEVEDPGP